MIWLIIMFGLGLRLVLLNQSLWWDEAINVVAARSQDFWNFVYLYPRGDFHPPLYFGLLWVWIHLFGSSEVIVRLPSVFLGVASVYLVFVLGKEMFNRRVGLMAATLVASSPILIYYSQEARMYSLAVFSCLVSFWAFWHVLNSRKSFLMVYLLSVVLVLYSDYPVMLILVGQLLFAAVVRKKFREILFSQLVGGLFYLPWLPVFWQQLQIGQSSANLLPVWGKEVGGVSLKELGLVWVKGLIGRISFDSKEFYVGFVGLVTLIYGGLLLKLRKPSQRQVLLLVWWLLPLLLMWLVSFKLPVLAYFRVIFIWPAFYLLIASLLDNFPDKPLKFWWFGLVGLNLICWLIFVLNPAFGREDWRGAVWKINQKMSADQGAVVFEDNNLPSTVKYYIGDALNYQGVLLRVPAKNLEDVKLPDNRNIYLFEYLVGINDPSHQVEQLLTSSGYQLKEIDNFHGVGFVRHYQR